MFSNKLIFLWSVSWFSPDSSRSSESASPQISKEDIINQSHLLLSQQFLQQEQHQQQHHTNKELAEYPQLGSPSFSIPNASNVLDHYTLMMNLRNQQPNSSSLHKIPKSSQSGFSPRSQTPGRSIFNGQNNLPIINGFKMKRSHQHDLAMLRKRPTHDIQQALVMNVRGSSRSPSSRDSSQSMPREISSPVSKNKNKAALKTESIRHCQQAVLDCAVAFCCLDGRWFDSVSGMGLREFAQAFINIGAQFGIIP